VAEYRSEMDILGQWIAENCEVRPDLQIQASCAYANYKEWAKTNGFQELSSNSFGRRLKERHARIKTRDGTFYQGLKPSHNIAMDAALAARQ
jgi:putative DNA primase/helicase